MRRIILTGYVPGLNGISTCVHNLYGHLDKERFDWVFIVSSEYEDRPNLLKPIRDMGGEIIFLDYTNSHYPEESQLKMRQMMAEIPDLYGVHVQDVNLNVFPLLLADEMNLPVKVIQHHNPVNKEIVEKCETGELASFTERRKRISGDQFCRLACSEDSGRCAYGDYPFTVFPNAIDLARFSWNPLYGSLIREKLGIRKEAHVLGFSANFSEYKNPMFAARVFEAFHRKVPDSHMILCGDGGLRRNIYGYFDKAGLLPFVHFLGEQSQIELFMNAMDLFLAPSRKEGLPYALVEAQATGLPCLISDEITDMVCMTPIVRKESIREDPEVWADKAIQMLKGYKRVSFGQEISDVGFDILQATDELMHIYTEQIEGR